MLLRQAWKGLDVHYATTLSGLAERSGVRNVHLVPDCNRSSRLAILRTAVATLLLLLRLRPDVIVTTGALPALLAIAIGKRLGAATIWVDSVANAEEMSLAGQRAEKHADLWMSQWPDVAEAHGADYAGSVL